MKTTSFKIISLLVIALLLSACERGPKKTEVIIAYQTDPLPLTIALASGEAGNLDGYSVQYRKFNSGADVLAALTAGDVQIGYSGSTPLAASSSRGIPFRIFYVASVSGADEALVARNGSGITSTADLKGKKLAVAPASTDHYQLLALLDFEHVAADQTTVLLMSQTDIAAAWSRGDIDAAFVWNPVLDELRKNGTVIATSADVAERGAATFSAWIVEEKFAKEHAEFVRHFAAQAAAHDQSYLADPSAWSPTSENAKITANFLGGTPELHSGSLARLKLLPLDQQQSQRWLAGGESAGIARVLADTSAFLKKIGLIGTVRPNYADYFTPAFIQPSSQAPIQQLPIQQERPH